MNLAIPYPSSSSPARFVPSSIHPFARVGTPSAKTLRRRCKRREGLRDSVGTETAIIHDFFFLITQQRIRRPGSAVFTTTEWDRRPHEEDLREWLQGGKKAGRVQNGLRSGARNAFEVETRIFRRTRAPSKFREVVVTV